MSMSSFFTLANAIRAMLVIGLVTILLVFAQSCQPPKSGLDLFAKDSLKKLKVLAAPPVQPTMRFYLPDETEMQLADYRGKLILVNVWATWCAPCVAEMPTLDRLQANRGGADFEIVTISLDRTAEEAEAFFEENTIHNLPAWHDGTFSLNAKLVLPGLPTSIFYDSQGREVARIPGEVDWMSEEAHAMINHMTQQR